MKRRVLIGVLCVLLCVCLPLGVAAARVDTARESSLTVVYQDGDTPFAGLEVRLFRVADVSPDGTLTLSGAFADYPVTLYADSREEWRLIAYTLASYAVADGLTPMTVTTDAAGAAAFDGLTAGLYLTQAVRVESETAIVLFEDFLTAIPTPNTDGTYTYDVTAYPKHGKLVPTPQAREYTVMKQWADAAARDKRPAQVRVDIYRNTTLHSTQVLSAENNWTYTWSSPDDGSVWLAVERDIPADYTVTINALGDTTVITNVYDEPTPPPTTGDTTVLWPYILALCVSGAVLIVLAVCKKGKK